MGLGCTWGHVHLQKWKAAPAPLRCGCSYASGRSDAASAVTQPHHRQRHYKGWPGSSPCSHIGKPSCSKNKERKPVVA